MRTACSSTSSGRERAAPRRVLNVHQFTSIEDATAEIEAWRVDYNQRRPHSSLGHLTPYEFAAQRQAMRTAAEAASL